MSLENLDFAILRESLRNRVFGWEGFDPRRSAEEIGRALQVSPGTVRRHLADWRSTGFFRGFYVMPHPDLLGVKSRWTYLTFSDTIHVPPALRSLGLLDGTIWAFELPDRLYVHFVGENDASLDRRVQLMAQLPGLTKIEPAILYTPPCGHVMSRLDWRMVQVLRQTPEIPLPRLAESLGVSLKTTRLRFDALVESNAVSFFPEFGVNEFPGSFKVFFAVLEDPTRSEVLAEEIGKVFPNAIRTFGPGCAPPGEPSPVAAFVVGASSDANLQDASLAVRRIPGVAATFLEAVNRFTRYTAWTDERIAALLDGRSSLLERSGRRKMGAQSQ